MNTLADAIAFLNGRVESVKRYIQTATVDLPEPEKPLVSELNQELASIAQKLGEQSQLAANILGEESSSAAMTRYLQLRQDMVKLEKAGQLGLVDSKELEEGLTELRKRLRLARINAEGAGADIKSVEANSGLSLGIASRLRGRIDEAGSLLSRGASFALDQVGGIATGLMGQLRGTPMAAGLFGLMLFGYKENDRLATQLGEVVNYAVAAGESATNPAIARLAAFQEQAQRYYGISRREIQGNLKTYIEAGLNFEEIFKQQAGGWGQVGESAIHMSVALDRHFEVSGGTTARMAAKAVREYGMTLESSLNTIRKIAFASPKAGAGSGEFLNWTFQATANIRNLGVGIEDAALAALTVQRGLKSGGIGDDLASNTAQQGVGELYAGLGRRSTGEQIDFAERLGFGSGLAGRENFLEGNAGRSDIQLKMIKMLFKDAMFAGGGDENQARFYAEQKGYGFEGARAMIILGKKLEEGSTLEDLNVKEREDLKNAYKTESQKVSEFEKDKKLMLEGMAKAGQSLLAILSNFAAIAITGMVSLPILLAGKPEDKERVYGKLLEYQKAVYTSWSSTVDGGKMVMDGIGKVMLPILQPVTKALAFDPRGGANPTMAPMAALTDTTSHDILDNAFRKLTGRGISPEEEAAISGVTGLSKGDIGRLAGTSDGQATLANAIAASRRAAAGTVKNNPVSGAGFKPGPAGKPDNQNYVPMGLGSLGDAPLPPEPLPDGTTPVNGPLGANIPLHGRWEVPPGYNGPLEAHVEITVG